MRGSLRGRREDGVSIREIRRLGGKQVSVAISVWFCFYFAISHFPALYSVLQSYSPAQVSLSPRIVFSFPLVQLCFQFPVFLWMSSFRLRFWGDFCRL